MANETRKVMRKKLATIPELKKSSGTWFIYFSVRDPLTGKMKPYKIYKGFNKCKTEKQCQEWGALLKEQYAQKLRNGWSPLFDQEGIIYSDQLEYQNFNKNFQKSKLASKDTRFFLNEYLNQRNNGLSLKTCQTYVSKLRIFCNWLEFSGYVDYDVTLISNKIILEFFNFLITVRKLDKRSIEKYKQIIHDYYRYLFKKEIILENPIYDITMPPKTKDMAARPISNKDLKKLLGTIQESDPQLYLACMFQFYLAIRPGRELRLLQIKDIDLYNKTVVITEENAKVSRRTVDMSEDLVELCNQYMIPNYNREFYLLGRERIPGPKPLGQNTMRNRFNKYRDELNLPDIYKFYSMKHTGGGKLLQAGFTIEEIKSHFGHSSIETTDRYLKKHFGNRNKNIIHNFPKPY